MGKKWTEEETDYLYRITGTLPVYIPKAPVCHKTQYQCCKDYTTCRLYHICSKFNSEPQQIPCKKDCPTCTYVGCSLSFTERKLNPIYINSFIQSEHQDINIELRRLREHEQHRKKHKSLYRMYNLLFGDLKEKERISSQKKYWKDPDYSRQQARESYERKHPKQLTMISSSNYTPECNLDCFNCKYDDCILSENWLAHARNKKWYDSHRAEILERQKTRRQRPDVKIARKEYDKKYNLTHPESAQKRQKKYREAHPEKIKEISLQYRIANKEKLQAIASAKRNFKRKIEQGIIQRVKFREGIYENITLSDTSLRLLSSDIGEKGKLRVCSNNYLIFTCNGKRTELFVEPISEGGFHAATIEGEKGIIHFQGCLSEK